MVRSILLLLALFLVSSVSSAQTTSLSFDSQPGDYIGGGIQQAFTEADGVFVANANAANGVSLSFQTPTFSHFWYLDFSAPDAAPLVPGVYEGAARYPFQAAGQPGLSVGGDGRGCNTLTGRFEVLEVSYGPSGNVVSFAADFEQHCEGTTPALFGTIRFNSGAPMPPRSA